MRVSGMGWCVVAGAALLLTGCAAIEKGGAYTRMSGESLTDYSKKNDGFVGTMAGVGGAINTTVGGAMENAAKGSGAESADKGKTETAAPAAKAPEPMSIADMQKRLAALGYPVGAADGVMGKRAVEALKAFQKDHKLAVTGELNNETIARLRAAKSSG